MYKDLFKELRKKESDPKERFTFPSDLFSGVSSILHSWVIKESVEEEVKVAKFEKLSPKENIFFQKEEVLESLKEFVDVKGEEKEGEVEKIVRFPGGEVALREDSNKLKNENMIQTFESYEKYISMIQNCSRCPSEFICNRKKVSFEIAQSPLRVLFVGDFPKIDSEECFSGEIRELLNKMTKAMKLSPEEFAYTLISKCVASDAKKSSEDKMAETCITNLYQEILFYKPEIIVTLGTRVSNWILHRNEKMGKIHGQFFTKKIVNGESEFNFILMPTFHPELLLVNPDMKKTAWADLQNVMKHIGKV